MALQMKLFRKYRNPWTIPFIFLLLVMALSFVMILGSVSSGESTDIRSRAFDEVREVPNGRIPRPTGAITMTPNPYATVTPPSAPLKGMVITGVPASTRAPLLNQTPQPTSSITPISRPPCTIVYQFMGIPCRPKFED